jgi:hypothetical protein
MRSRNGKINVTLKREDLADRHHVSQMEECAEELQVVPVVGILDVRAKEVSSRTNIGDAVHPTLTCQTDPFSAIGPCKRPVSTPSDARRIRGIAVRWQTAPCGAPPIPLNFASRQCNTLFSLLQPVNFDFCLCISAATYPHLSHEQYLFSTCYHRPAISTCLRLPDTAGVRRHPT